MPGHAVEVPPFSSMTELPQGERGPGEPSWKDVIPSSMAGLLRTDLTGLPGLLSCVSSSKSGLCPPSSQLSSTEPVGPGKLCPLFHVFPYLALQGLPGQGSFALLSHCWPPKDRIGLSGPGQESYTPSSMDDHLGPGHGLGIQDMEAILLIFDCSSQALEPGESTPAIFFSWPYEVMPCPVKSGCRHCNPSSMDGLLRARHALGSQTGSPELPFPMVGLFRDGHALESQTRDTAPLSFVIGLCMAKQVLWSKVREYVPPSSTYDHCRLHRLWRGRWGVCDPMPMTPTAGPHSSSGTMLGKLCLPFPQQSSSVQARTWCAMPRCALSSTDDLLWACPVQVSLAGEALHLSWLDTVGPDLP